MEFQSFSNLAEAKKYFVNNKIKVCGVEIGEGSRPVQEHPFQGDTAFFMGNEGSGILPIHREICDHFVYIPQYTEKTASLNVYVAAGIVFHHFALWANYKEAKLYGEKYQFQEEPIGVPKSKNLEHSGGPPDKQINHESTAEKEH
jgi:tRNA(Leu) C34 or U34 (ribose-2'-O)-methylase TrmL